MLCNVCLVCYVRRSSEYTRFLDDTVTSDSLTFKTPHVETLVFVCRTISISSSLAATGMSATVTREHPQDSTMPTTSNKSSGQICLPDPLRSSSELPVSPSSPNHTLTLGGLVRVKVG